MAEGEFIRAQSGETALEGEARWFFFVGDKVLLEEGPRGYNLPLAASAEQVGLDVAPALYLGRLDGTPCMALALPETTVPPGYKAVDLRTLYGLVLEPAWRVAGLAAQLLHWTETARYCPRTGHPTQRKEGEWAMEFPSCGFLQYPRVHPCVIVLIHHGDRVLLTRQAPWPPNRYGLVAGFVEPAETLEECLRREVREETGIAVDDLRYFASQSWPFPHQLMVGFTARYAGGEITIDTRELEDARWFSLDALPTLPTPFSIARRIIDAHVAAHGRVASSQ